MTYKIVTDSTTDLSEAYAKAHDIIMLGLTVTIADITYETVGPNRLASDFLLSKMAEGATPVTSQINVGQFLAAFKSVVLAGDEVLYIGFSSGLSGTVQSAKMAKEMLLDEIPTAKITIFDTLAAASGEGYLVREAVKLRDQGKLITDLVKSLRDISPRLRSWVMADDLFHLARGGRISRTAATVGTIVNIKPIIDVDPEGKLRQVGKIRGKKKAINLLIEKTLDGLDDQFPQVLIGYSGSSDVAASVKATLLTSKLVQEVILTPLGPTIATHTGIGTLAVFSIGKTKRV
ncbi:DegV family protein [Lactococcus paracarnosus]|uniref:DegV family protein n=1 Tax=Pseudolactococcus paracarnosus TaxID=2749962 RepID=A0ABT0AN92_9LACT|nr:DegV family protein [Lactococcus paracarnosus]MCJ1977948.1 DegV family protein [Lactococcus paracarnosus]MCJ1984091.1 DegV family protein [Lactococcus paracarnosus]MCJ1997904.1 DegV family protein [Lactococcus paracarnosus]